MQYVEKKMIKPKRFAQRLHFIILTIKEDANNKTSKKKHRYTYNAANELAGGKILKFFFVFFFVSMYYIVLKMLSMPVDENFSKSINEDTYLLASSKR